MIRVIMEFDDGNAQGSQVETFIEGLKLLRGWMNEWADSPGSDDRRLMRLELSRVDA